MFSRLARDLICTIQTFTVIKFSNCQFINDFSRNQFSPNQPKFVKFNSREKLIPSRHFDCWSFNFPWFLYILFSFRKPLANYEHANKFDIIYNCYTNDEEEKNCILLFAILTLYHLRLKLWKTFTRNWYD